MALKYSKQRELIKNFLISRKDHPTADVVYTNIQQELPNISLGTVYRNLSLLADLGEIRRLRFNDGIDHFDADTSLHHHFLCSKCNQIIDLDIKLDDITTNAHPDFGGEIQGHITYFYGICENCKQ